MTRIAGNLLTPSQCCPNCGCYPCKPGVCVGGVCQDVSANWRLNVSGFDFRTNWPDENENGTFNDDLNGITNLELNLTDRTAEGDPTQPFQFYSSPEITTPFSQSSYRLRLQEFNPNNFRDVFLRNPFLIVHVCEMVVDTSLSWDETVPCTRWMLAMVVAELYDAGSTDDIWTPQPFVGLFGSNNYNGLNPTTFDSFWLLDLAWTMPLIPRHPPRATDLGYNPAQHPDVIDAPYNVAPDCAAAPPDLLNAAQGLGLFFGTTGFFWFARKGIVDQYTYYLPDWQNAKFQIVK